MKIIVVALASIVATASSWYALAAGDYERLKKDVGVMSQIIDSVFKADTECRQCKVNIDGKYLANQGIVFMVKSRTHTFSWTGSNDSSNSYNFSIDDFEEFEHIPEMVEGIIADVLPSIPRMPASREDWTHNIEITGDSTREALREIRRERRELQQDIRENEIEIIHMEEVEAKALESAIKEMEKAAMELEKQQAQIEDKVRTTREEYRKTREESLQKKAQLRAEQQEVIQDKVLQAFCDYGSTLRSLPSKEKVSIIFENTHTETRQDTVLVFDQNKITDCDRNKGSLREQALTYLF
jgi:hypothetical protein